jgi:putative CocE/NonD family hydrolase
MFQKFCIGVALAVVLAGAKAQDLPFSMAHSIDSPAVPHAMADLAERLMLVYPKSNQLDYLNALFTLQAVARRYGDASDTMRSIRAISVPDSQQRRDVSLVFESYVLAKASEQNKTDSFTGAFSKQFRAVLAPLDNPDAYRLAYAFSAIPFYIRQAMTAALGRYGSASHVSRDEALSLLQLYLALETFSDINPLVGGLIAEDDRRRYEINEDSVIKTTDGTTVSAVVIRPKGAGRLPTLMEFSIYTDHAAEDVKESAAHGYVGVYAFTRGKGGSSAPIEPFEHDGLDAQAVIRWIARQPWSDGRVGMYGGSYNGFTQWAAAKNRPSALKAIMPSASAVPGLDRPIQRGIFVNGFYPWVPYTTDNKWADNVTYNDDARWNLLNRTWYLTGDSYRSLERLDGTPSPIYRRWLAHPSYDAYWQRMVPYKAEFANIDIPVLQTTGYFDGGHTGALYYFTEHHKYNPNADDTLVIGPYSHTGGAQHQSEDVLDGYTIDPAARIDIHQLRYAWYDYLFKHGPKPELLSDTVNFEVMGKNEWRHAHSLEQMSTDHVRFYLGPALGALRARLSDQPPTAEAYVDQVVNFADRTDVNWVPSSQILSGSLDTHNGIAYATAPLDHPTEIDGALSGQLDFIVNKKDMDISIIPYEELPDGNYLRLSEEFMFRMSYLKDPSHRQLLTPGMRSRVPVECACITARKLSAGSRLVMLVSINKRQDREINYGTGRDVSDETIDDAKEPLKIRWFGDSYIDMPLRKDLTGQADLR